MSNYENAEHFGYKVGDKFKYVPEALDINERFDPHDVLTLVSDDGSTCPQFENQNSIAGYEYLSLLEKLEEIKDKPLNYTDFVGKSLIVKEFGYGFLKSDIGRICKIEAYSDNGYAGGKGFKVEGYDNYGRGFVGVKSFFPDDLISEVTEHVLLEPTNPQKVTETVTICPSITIQEMLLTCFDSSVDITISTNSIRVKWRGLVFLVDKKANLEQIIKAIDLLSGQHA